MFNFPLFTEGNMQDLTKAQIQWIQSILAFPTQRLDHYNFVGLTTWRLSGVILFATIYHFAFELIWKQMYSYLAVKGHINIEKNFNIRNCV